jgi:hypothetical protein
VGLHQAGIPHKYPAKPKPTAAAKAEPDTTAAAGRSDKGGGDVAAAGEDASKPTAAPAPGVSIVKSPVNLVENDPRVCSWKAAEDASTKL